MELSEYHRPNSILKTVRNLFKNLKQKCTWSCLSSLRSDTDFTELSEKDMAVEETTRLNSTFARFWVQILKHHQTVLDWVRQTKPDWIRKDPLNHFIENHRSSVIEYFSLARVCPGSAWTCGGHRTVTPFYVSRSCAEANRQWKPDFFGGGVGCASLWFEPSCTVCFHFLCPWENKEVPIESKIRRTTCRNPAWERASLFTQKLGVWPRPSWVRPPLTKFPGPTPKTNLQQTSKDEHPKTQKLSWTHHESVCKRRYAVMVSRSLREDQKLSACIQLMFVVEAVVYCEPVYQPDKSHEFQWPSWCDVFLWHPPESSDLKRCLTVQRSRGWDTSVCLGSKKMSVCWFGRKNWQIIHVLRGQETSISMQVSCWSKTLLVTKGIWLLFLNLQRKEHHKQVARIRRRKTKESMRIHAHTFCTNLSLTNFVRKIITHGLSSVSVFSKTSLFWAIWCLCGWMWELFAHRVLMIKLQYIQNQSKNDTGFKLNLTLCWPEIHVMCQKRQKSWAR